MERIRHIVATILSLAALLAAQYASADVAFMTCPNWTAAGAFAKSTPEFAALLTALRPRQSDGNGPACGGGVKCTNGSDDLGNSNPTGYVCTVTVDPGVDGCYATYVTGVSGLATHTTDAPDSSGLYHCAFVYTVGDAARGKNEGPPPCPNCAAGNPINGGTGNKFQVETDIEPAYESGVKLARTYNSVLGDERTFFGSGWRHTWDRKIEPLTATSVQAARPDGKRFSFHSSGTDWIGDPDIPDRLEKVGTVWRLTTRDDELETYDETGKLQTLVSRGGQLTTLTYSDGSVVAPNGAVFIGTQFPLYAGFLIRVTDYRGRSLGFQYGLDGTVKVTKPSLDVYTYTVDSSTGNLSKVDYGGPQRTYLYNESQYTQQTNLPGALTGIIDENLHRLSIYKYDFNGKAISTEAALGASLPLGIDRNTFQYSSGTTIHTDSLGTSRTVTFATPPPQGVMLRSGTTQPCADCGGNVSDRNVLDANGNVTEYKDFNGNLTCSAFDSRNLELTRTEGLSGANCASRQTTSATRTISRDWHPTFRMVKRIAEPLRIITYAFNGEGGVTCAPGGTSAALICSKTEQATTDASGDAQFGAQSDGQPRVWTYTYNERGQILTLDGPRLPADVHDITTYGYYSVDSPSGDYRAGDLASITNALGQITQIAQYDGNGRVKKMIDPNGLETIMTLDQRDLLRTRQVGAGLVHENTTFDYDDSKQLRKVTLPDSSSVSYIYDDAHRLTDQCESTCGISSAQTASTTCLVTVPEYSNQIHYILDSAGNRVRECAFDASHHLVRQHSREYDALNRLKRDIGGSSPGTQITQNGYDGNGNLTSITDPLARLTTQIYDSRNRLTEVRDPFNGSAAPTKYEYNGQDQLAKVIDPTNLATTYALNGYGETRSQVSPDTGTTTLAYDPASNVSTKVDARGITATYTYDALNRVKQVSYPDETVLYTYDSCTNGIGRLCAISDKTGTTSYSYDLWGRITLKTQTARGLSLTNSYRYNSAGQLDRITTPSGRQITYSYANNRPVSAAVDGTTVLDTVVYEPFGPIGGWRWGNSTTGVPNLHLRQFDLDFRALEWQSNQPALSPSQPLLARTLTWDDASRITHIDDPNDTANRFTYGYDALDRLTSAGKAPDPCFDACDPPPAPTVTTYHYDGVGNRLVTSDAPPGVVANLTYTYWANTHRLKGQGLNGGPATTSYGYDSTGNLTTRTDGWADQAWVYGGNNRPEQFAVAGAVTTLDINALGQRVRKGSTWFTYDEMGHLLGEYNLAGALVQETVWLGDFPIATLRPNGASASIFYVHPDHLGAPFAVTRPSDNQLVWQWNRVEAFGNSSPEEDPSGLGTFAFNLRFPGQYFDAETGTHYNYYRDYDPSIGRYVESDPIGLKGGLNTYLYALGTPTSRSDKFGLDTKRDPSGGSAWCRLNCDAWRHTGHALCNIMFGLVTFNPTLQYLCNRNEMYKWVACIEKCDEPPPPPPPPTPAPAPGGGSCRPNDTPIRPFWMMM
jgi:RHS repeat-associated protein